MTQRQNLKLKKLVIIIISWLFIGVLISFYDYPIQKRNLIEIKFLKTHSGEIKCFDISNDGKFVLTGSNDTVVRVWDFVERKQISCFFGH